MERIHARFDRDVFVKAPVFTDATTRELHLIMNEAGVGRSNVRVATDLEIRYVKKHQHPHWTGYWYKTAPDRSVRVGLIGTPASKGATLEKWSQSGGKARLMLVECDPSLDFWGRKPQTKQWDCSHDALEWARKWFSEHLDEFERYPIKPTPNIPVPTIMEDGSLLFKDEGTSMKVMWIGTGYILSVDPFKAQHSLQGVLGGEGGGWMEEDLTKIARCWACLVQQSREKGGSHEK